MKEKGETALTWLCLTRPKEIVVMRRGKGDGAIKTGNGVEIVVQGGKTQIKSASHGGVVVKGRRCKKLRMERALRRWVFGGS